MDKLNRLACRIFGHVWVPLHAQYNNYLAVIETDYACMRCGDEMTY